MGGSAEYCYKSYDLTLKDIDSKKGIVQGLLSKYSMVDSDGDTIYPGAARKTISENGPKGSDRIKHLRNHSVFDPIGKFLELDDTTEGIPFTSQMSKATSGRDTLIMYEEGILKEHSIGFKSIKSEDDDETGGRRIYEIQLWEGSTVTWGANERALVESVKGSLLSPEGLIEKTKKMQKLLRGGNLSDEMCQLFEIQLKQLEQFLIDVHLQPPDSTVKPDILELVSKSFKSGLVIEQLKN